MVLIIEIYDLRIL